MASTLQTIARDVDNVRSNLGTLSSTIQTSTAALLEVIETMEQTLQNLKTHVIATGEHHVRFLKLIDEEQPALAKASEQGDTVIAPVDHAAGATQPAVG